MDRNIPLAGCFNFRDLGGYPTADGRQLAWRRIFRSDGLQNLSEDDIELLRDNLRLQEIIDLRSSHELNADGRGRLEETAIRFHHVPLFDGGSGVSAQTPRDMKLDELYFGLLDRAQTPVAKTVEIIANTEDKASAVYHCAAGKDRTGVISAVLLSLLGVEDELIVADYALTEASLDEIINRLTELRGYDYVYEELPPETLHAKPETMRSLIARVADRWGSFEGYILDAGLDPALIGKLRERCLEPA